MLKKSMFVAAAFILMFAGVLTASASGHNRNGNGQNNNYGQTHRNSHGGTGSSSGSGTGSTPPITVPPVLTGNATTITAYLTSYQAGDNSPAGNATFIDGISGTAGGVGTYANPITMAVGYVGSVADYAPGTMFYVTALQKFFVAGDTCASCHQGNGGLVWMDMYSGDYSSQAGLACEDAITNNYTVIINPPSTEPVNTTPLFNGSQCIL